jgi:hypothetical protein
MDLDLLNENYATVVSKLPFEKLYQAGLTGLSCRSNRILPDLPNSGVNICSLFLGKACVPRNIYSEPKLHRNNVKNKNSKQVLLFKHDRIYRPYHLNLWNTKNTTCCWCLWILRESNKPEHTSSVVGYWNINSNSFHTCKFLWMLKATKLLFCQLVIATLPNLTIEKNKRIQYYIHN